MDSVTDALWTPQNHQLEQQVESAVQTHVRAAQELEARLRRGLDDKLRVVLGKPNSVDPDVIPGYWHICRLNEGYAHTYLPFPGAKEGVYREPGEWVYGWLKENDMWDKSVADRLRNASRDDRERRAKQGRDDREAMKDDAAAAVRAAKRVRDERGMLRSSAAKRAGKGIKGY